MRNILCPLCEHDHTSLVAQRRERGLTITTVGCRDCGLVYHNPVIEDQDRLELAVSHRQWHTGDAGLPRQLRKLEKRWNLQWPMIQPVFQPGCRVLEVGCGLGLVGARLKSLGARVWAVEPDPEQAAYARDHHGLTVFSGRFEEAAFEAAPFDLILASHVIEHFPEPLAFLRRARTCAHPETWLFLETPNILAPKVSFRRMFSPAHNFYFAPQTLRLAAHQGRLAGGKAAGVAPGRLPGAGPPRRPPTARGGPPGGRPGQAGHRPPPVPLLPEIAVHLAQDALVAEILDVPADRSPAGEPRPGLRSSGPAGSPWPCLPEPGSRVGAGLWGE